MRHAPDTDFLREWLEGTEGGPSDPVEGTKKAMSHLDETKQANRWLPFPVFYRSAHTTARPQPTDTAEYPSSPIPATNGHTPTVIGRTTSMLSPIKAITVGALVFAIGGVMLIAQPFGQQGTVPGAESGVPDLVPFTARYVFQQGRAGDATTLPNGTPRVADEAWVFRSIEASDPRLEGNMVVNATYDQYDGVSLTTHVLRIENDAGAWQEGPYYRMTWSGRDTPGDEEVQAGEARQGLLVGEGEYEGLVALVVSTEEVTGGGSSLLEGYIVDGDLPPVPDPFSPPRQN